jgi:CBS domain containing-hemolysin-like protein
LKKNRRGQKKRTILWVIMVGFWTFILAVIFSLVTQLLLKNLQSVLISFILLILVIFIGIFFDIIGTAITAADEKPFHSKAAKKIYGAKKGIYLVRNAEQVANFCNDVIGDISGIVSGSIGAMIIISLAVGVQEPGEIYLSIIMAGVVSAITVGGKAYGKSLAINNSIEIVLAAARIITTLEKALFWKNTKRRRIKGDH